VTRFVFITGGVVSSLGKGISAASLGALLEARGLAVSMIKLDPYINVDPGTMSPFQHGEVFVTADGAETDLDLGHYERFVDFRASKASNWTTGQIYERVIARERRGEYLGATVQVIPHITDEIKRCVGVGAADADICIVEIGGTVGDIESLPFIEAIRQMGGELGPSHAAFLHLTLVPYIKVSGEIKTKPTQHSVKELRSIGIQPDILLCRTDMPIPEDQRKKIALFTNVAETSVIEVVNQDDIHSIPLALHEQDLDDIVVAQFGLDVPEADLSQWRAVVAARKAQKESVVVAMVGKYVDLTESYKSLNEALQHAGLHNQVRVEIRYVDSEQIEQEGTAPLEGADVVLVPGGFGERGIEGKIMAVRYARENRIPYLGICLGMQVAVIEYARDCLGLEGAHSTEFDKDTPHPVVALITEWMDREGEMEMRNAHSDLGGTMRLGEQPCQLEEGSRLRQIYESNLIHERHRHRYEINNNYLEQLTGNGMQVVGRSHDDRLVEAVELTDHPWFIGCQFHPEFTSTPLRGHPLFNSLIRAARS